MPNIIMADKAAGEWTTEQIVSKQGPSGNITLEGTSYPAYAIFRIPAVTQVHFVNAAGIPERGVAECAGVQRIIAQKAANVGATALAYNRSLLTIDILGGGTISGNLGFGNNQLLETLIIRSTAAKDVNTNSFQGSVSEQKPVHVYVPQATISNYTALNNWASLVNAGKVIFEELEGSPYEPLDWWED